MSEISRAGRTVLFVSHNPTALKNLCSSGLLLEEGAIVKRGMIEDVLWRYAGGHFESNTKVLPVDRRGPIAPAVVTAVCVAGTAGDLIQGSSSFTIGVEVKVNEPGDIAAFVQCYDSNHQPVFSTGSFFENELNGRLIDQGYHIFECVVPGNLLNDGVYTLDVHLIKNRQAVIHFEKSVISFRVNDDFKVPIGWNWRPAGVIRPKTNWRQATGRLLHRNAQD
jgi:lipopolysaccharide transport system ATP-binding protein